MYLAILAAEEAKKSTGSGLLTFIPILAIGGAMYFLLIRPQRKRMRDQQGLLKTIDEGDEIITSGGIYGFVTAVDGDVLWVEIDHEKKVEIRIHRSSVSRKINPTVEPAGGEPVVVDPNAPLPSPNDADQGKADDGKADQ
jgi:preprotein translocase subunit YajC